MAKRVFTRRDSNLIPSMRAPLKSNMLYTALLTNFKTALHYIKNTGGTVQKVMQNDSHIQQ